MTEFDDSDDILMNNDQFLFAVKGTRLSKKSIAIARRILVDKEERSIVIEDEGLTKQRLSTISLTVEKNYHYQLAKHNMFHVEVVVDESTKKALMDKEKKILKSILAK